jgi:hypothetical protein
MDIDFCDAVDKLKRDTVWLCRNLEKAGKVTWRQKQFFDKYPGEKDYYSSELNCWNWDYKAPCFIVSNRYCVCADCFDRTVLSFSSYGVMLSNSVKNYNNKCGLFIIDKKENSIIHPYPMVKSWGRDDILAFLMNDCKIEKTDNIKCAYYLYKDGVVFDIIYGKGISDLNDYFKKRYYKVTNRKKINANETAYSINVYRPTDYLCLCGEIERGLLVDSFVLVIKRKNL